MRKITPIEFVDSSAVRLLDQRALPAEIVYINYSDIESLSQAITDMVVRGAPAIGITAAYGLALAAYNAGPHRVKRAMRSQEANHGDKQFWDLRLPRETREYVPKILALIAIVREEE